MRTAEQLMNRIAVQFALGGLAEDEVDPEALLEWLDDEEFAVELAPVERRLFLKPLEERETNACSWKTESVAILCFCGGVLDGIGEPTAMTDWDLFFPRIPPEIERDNFLSALRLRALDEVLLEVDFYYLLHAAVLHPELWLKGRECPGNIQIAIVEERRRALEWFVERSRAHWTEVALDT